MRELKKVTVNVANVELYCKENCNGKTNCYADHVCPTAAQVKAWDGDDGCFVVTDICYDRIADHCNRVMTKGDYYCSKNQSNYGHFLVGKTVYCMRYFWDGTTYRSEMAKSKYYK